MQIIEKKVKYPVREYTVEWEITLDVVYHPMLWGGWKCIFFDVFEHLSTLLACTELINSPGIVLRRYFLRTYVWNLQLRRNYQFASKMQTLLSPLFSFFDTKEMSFRFFLYRGKLTAFATSVPLAISEEESIDILSRLEMIIRCLEEFGFFSNSRHFIITGG
jgi:hypothetical protein